MKKIQNTMKLFGYNDFVYEVTPSSNFNDVNDNVVQMSGIINYIVTVKRLCNELIYVDMLSSNQIPDFKQDINKITNATNDKINKLINKLHYDTELDPLENNIIEIKKNFCKNMKSYIEKIDQKGYDISKFEEQIKELDGKIDQSDVSISMIAVVILAIPVGIFVISHSIVASLASLALHACSCFPDKNSLQENLANKKNNLDASKEAKQAINNIINKLSVIDDNHQAQKI